MLSEIINFITLFGGFLSIVVASAHLADRNRTDANYLTAAFLFSIGIWQVYHGFMITGILFRYPHLALVHVPFLYLSAPLLYFYYRILTGYNFRFKPSCFYHFIPVIIILIMITPFYIKTSAEKLELLQNFVGSPVKPKVFPQYPYIVMSILTVMCGYACAVVLDIMHFYRKKLLIEINTTFYSIVIVAFNFAVIIIYITGFLFVKFLHPGSYYLVIIKSISMVMALEIYLILLLKWRYPGYIGRIKIEAQRLKYATSRIEKIDVDSILDKLTDIMENEKAFCDEDLSLGKLAHELEITPYQLSQILNERLNKNFNTFINEYRIRESENYLTEDRKRSVLSISFAVGFNTVTSYYNAFYKIHGITPAQYRDKNRKHQ